MEKRGDHSHGGQQAIRYEQGYLLPESEVMVVQYSGRAIGRTKDCSLAESIREGFCRFGFQNGQW